jgi:hypothetical protein
MMNQRMRISALRVLFLVAGLMPVAAAVDSFAQQAREAGPRPTGTASIAGRVVRENAGVARVSVTLDASDGRGQRQTMTDDEGRFQFERLPAGRFLLTAWKPGWVASHYGSPRPGRPPGAPIAVADGARVADIRIPLVPGGVIAGTFVDSAGRPLARQFPILLEERLVGSRRMIARVRFPIDAGFFERSTDDRGEFRLFGLAPGTYYLMVQPSISSGARFTTSDEVRWASQSAGASAAPPLGAVAGYAPLFYPGTTDASAAQGIAIGPGEVKEGLTFRVSYAPVARITGVVQRPDGTPAAASTVTMNARETRALIEGAGFRATTGADGRFTIQSVPPGEYSLSARAASASAPAPTPGVTPGERAASTPVYDLWGERAVVVAGQDVENVSIALAPAASLSGRLVFEATTAKPPADLSQVRLQFIATEALAQAQGGGGGGLASLISATVQPDGTFRAVGLPPDRYTVTASWPGMRSGDGTSGWWLTTVHIDNRDLGDAPIDVRANADVTGASIGFRDRVGVIEGLLSDAAGRPAPEYFVVAFSADRASWTTTSRRFVAPVRPGTDGRYRVNGLLPGDYYLAVVTAVGQDESADPAFLEAILPSAIKITVAAGETRRQDLKIGR